MLVWDYQLASIPGAQPIWNIWKASSFSRVLHTGRQGTQPGKFKPHDGLLHNPLPLRSQVYGVACLPTNLPMISWPPQPLTPSSWVSAMSAVIRLFLSLHKPIVMASVDTQRPRPYPGWCERCSGHSAIDVYIPGATNFGFTSLEKKVYSLGWTCIKHRKRPGLSCIRATRYGWELVWKLEFTIRNEFILKLQAN